MTLITERSRNVAPTYVLSETGAVVECRKVDDAELADLVRNCDEWALCAPGLRGQAALLDRVALGLRSIRQGGSHVRQCYNEVDGDFELGFLTMERVDLAVLHGQRTLYAGKAERTTEDGTVLQVSVVVVAPDKSEQLNVQLLLD